MAMTDQNNYWGQPYPGYNGYNNNYYNQNWGYGAAPVAWNTAPNVSLQSSLSDAEIQSLKENKPAFNIKITQDEHTRAICNHKTATYNPVHTVNDGTGDFVCDICGTRWTPSMATKDEVEAAVNTLVNYFEHSKYVGNLPSEVIREFYGIIPLLKKFPELYELSMKNLNNLRNSTNMYDADDASVRQMYRDIIGYDAPYYPQPGYYQQPMNNGYYQQPMNNNGYYQPQPQQNDAGTNVVNPSVNPMQNTYGVNNAAPNQQFNSQANAMVNGGANYQPVPMGDPNAYQQPMMGNPNGYYQQPMMGNPYQQQPVNNTMPQYAPVGQQPQGQMNAGQTQVNNNAPAATNIPIDNQDATVVKDTKVTL